MAYHHIASGSALCGSPRVLKYRSTSDCIPRLATANTPNIIGSLCRVHRLFEYDRLLPALKGSALHPVLSIKTGVWLLWPLLTSARSPYELPHKVLPYNASYLPILNSSSLFCFSISGGMLSRYRRDLVNRLPLPVISPNGKMKHQKAACRTDLPG